MNVTRLEQMARDRSFSDIQVFQSFLYFLENLDKRDDGAEAKLKEIEDISRYMRKHRPRVMEKFDNM